MVYKMKKKMHSLSSKKWFSKKRGSYKTFYKSPIKIFVILYYLNLKFHTDLIL